MSKESYLKNQEIHKQREVERMFQSKRYDETIKSIKETDEIKLNIKSIVLDLLEELGFDRQKSGTLYLADMIESLYHERKAFDGENKFFDFNDPNNAHYGFTNEYYECGLVSLKKDINAEIEKSYVSDSSLNDIVYGVANDVISQYDRGGRQLILSQKK